jgi:bifunctional non-homologous end joining protein LigD
MKTCFPLILSISTRRRTLFSVCHGRAGVPKGLFAYVVQKHKATSLHYDFRLEIDGTMPSWSIPKGPTLDPKVKRLAMPTGPHDLEYRKFEGTISEGSYGAGAVMIWDEGTYSPEVEVSRGVRRLVTSRAEAQEVARSELSEGNLKFTLYGKKLQGSFALVRTKGLGGAREAWLLIKHRDGHCKEGYEAKDYDYSAATNKTLAQIAGDGTL